MIGDLFIFLLLFGYTKSVCAEDADDLSVDLGSLKFQHFNIRDYASCYLLGLLNSAVTEKDAVRTILASFVLQAMA